ncbi:ammonium transporter 3 member 1-like [Coffea eugenioides]|uniref:Ammonium transporter n=1 Tax=Coffea arabica TaxID=13443 RepID=A0A6P6TVW7_COFAR|nr:ammonium transporter 3 member 1-like [Coffea arabica]XP_027182227.1 ammonium transporter 3 member 1-like [Coffea eugenioides]
MSSAPPPPYFWLPKNLQPNDANPEWLNKGDNAWQLTAATLVGLQSVPGLIILYGGAVKKKWAVNSAFMALYAFACVLVCWVCWGYQLSFGNELIPIWGKINVALEQKYLLSPAFTGNFPNATMVFFQFVFAAITLILIAGAVLGRMNFYAWMLFVPLWLTFSYTFGAYTIWSLNGWLSSAGIIDYSGGYVIHLSSGVAGFTAAYWVGPRLTKDRQNFPPNNILLMLAGAGLLWMGWTGFNGGDPYAASIDASLAVLNTHVCTATSLLTWLILDIVFFGKASVIGVVQGMITGLVCITPAAGVVQGWAAILMGLCSGAIPWFTMMVVHKKSQLLQRVDDTMAVFHTHAVAGTLGGILTGLFAEPNLCSLFYGKPGSYTGLFYGFHNSKARDGFRQIGLQLIGVLFVVALNVVSTSLICLLIQLLVPLRMTEEDMEVGDEAAHGEEAYAIWGQGERLENSRISVNDVELGAPRTKESRLETT